MDGGPPLFPRRFLVSRGTPDTPSPLMLRLQDSHPLWCAFPYTSARSHGRLRCPYPDDIATSGLASSDFARLFLRGFPHSEICGSTDICSSPQLIAAYHVLLRLLLPRHSPCALSNLTVASLLVGGPVPLLTPPILLSLRRNQSACATFNRRTAHCACQ